MIVVEGPDGGGKTTLAQWICDTYGLKMGERSEKNRDLIYRTTREDTRRAFTLELACTAPPLVWDRLGPWSDPIYAPHMGRKIAFTWGEIELANHLMQDLGCPLIVCLPPRKYVKENVAKSHQIKAATDHVDEIYGKYLRLGFSSKRMVFFDYTKPDEHDRVGRRIEGYLDQRKERESFSSYSTHVTSASDPSPQEESA